MSCTCCWNEAVIILHFYAELGYLAAGWLWRCCFPGEALKAAVGFERRKVMFIHWVKLPEDRWKSTCLLGVQNTCRVFLLDGFLCVLTGKSLVHLRNPMETVKWDFDKNWIWKAMNLDNSVILRMAEADRRNTLLHFCLIGFVIRIVV